jgi:hypothetical protein
VNIGWREMVDALVIADMMAVFDESADLPQEIARQVIVAKQKCKSSRSDASARFRLGSA